MIQTRSERFTNKPKMYAEGKKSEKDLVRQLSDRSFEEKSFLDKGFLSEKDGLTLGLETAICPEINPDKHDSDYAIDLIIHFYQKFKDGWKKVKTSLGDLKTRNEPLYTAEKRYHEAKKNDNRIVEFPWYETVGLDFGNERVKREYARYLPVTEKKKDDVYLLYAINYEGTRPCCGKQYTFPEPNQNLWLTSTLRVREAEEAGLLLITDYSGFRFQLPFPLILPSGKPLFQKVISNITLEV